MKGTESGAKEWERDTERKKLKVRTESFSRTFKNLSKSLQTMAIKLAQAFQMISPAFYVLYRFTLLSNNLDDPTQIL